MDIYGQIATKIIEQQETIIGPIAVEQAASVANLTVDWTQKSVSVTGNGPSVIDELVRQYERLFGQIAVETCKDAAAKLILQLTPEQLPKSLQ